MVTIFCFVSDPLHIVFSVLETLLPFEADMLWFVLESA